MDLAVKLKTTLSLVPRILDLLVLQHKLTLHKNPSSSSARAALENESEVCSSSLKNVTRSKLKVIASDL
jgi:hypothetical protein